jgi:hypothetical protein
MYKKLLILLSFIGIALGAFADEVVFTASAPKQVVVGQAFRLVYTLNQRGRDLRTPEMENFDVVAGPSEAESSSFSFSNGHRTSSFEKTYTYMLVAREAGTFTIPPTTVKVSGETYSCNGLRIQVLPADKQPTQTGGSNASSGQQTNTQNADNIFIRTIVSKSNVHEQEALLVTYKLYFANVNGIQLTNNIKLPDFTGFLKQELDQASNQAELEHYNGRNYQTAVVYRAVLYPQHAGDLTIEPASFEFLISVPSQRRMRSFFDSPFDEVSRTVKAPSATIHVSALPAGKPAGFSGGVGKFSLTPSISQTELQANEAVTIKLDITGVGNMKLIKTPAVDWPEGFEPYDPKVSNNFSTTTAGVSGTKSIEYLAIPRQPGEYTIPAVTFSYFDIEDKAYRTLRTPEYTIRVKRGAGDANSVSDQQAVISYTQKEDIKQLGSDIRYINTKPLKASRQNSAISYQLLWLFYVVPLIIAIVLLIVLRKQIKEAADITRMRYKRANKVAKKRLKAAENAMKANNKDAFYEEIERAAWTYLSDRLSIPTADLNKENITAILKQKGVSDALIEQVMHVLSTAEFARYAPSTDHGMEDLYAATTNLIDNLEEEKL